MQQHSSAHAQREFSISRLRLAAIIAWTVLAIITAIWECHDSKEFKTSNALTMARASVDKDIVFRSWAAGHGGVYVPVTGKTPPNPWLNVPERDIVTPSGRRLTLMNPAYLTRQIFETGWQSPNSAQGHITSLKPIRPENSPDPWEARTLAAFEAGLPEFGEFQMLDGRPVFRYMRPLATEKACLKCHESQGYREGAIRGGISTIIPAAGLESAMRHSNLTHLSIIAIIWLLGFGGIWFGFHRVEIATGALTLERDNLSSVFDATPMPMLLADNRMEVARINSAFRDFCTDYNDLPDKRCGTLLKCSNALSEPEGCGNSPACESCRIARALREVLRSGLPVHGEASVPLAGPAGSTTEVWLLFGAEAVSLYGRRHVLLSFLDITGRKHEETVRHARAEEFRALVENSPDIITRYDRLCRRVYVNPAMEKLAGTSADLLTGKTPTETFVATPDVGWQVQSAVEQVLWRGVAKESELSWKDSNGVARHFQARYVPEYDANGEITSVLGITRDITSLRRTEAQLQHAQKMESIGTLAGGVAHDFNNILTVIGGYSELLRLSRKNDEKVIEFAREISDSVNRGAELTRSLLTFSGKHEPQMHYDNLNLIVANLQKSMSRLLRSDITLTFGLCENQLPVYADRLQIEQVLINLMVNARDALASGGTIDVTTALVEVDEETAVSGGATLSPGSYGLVTFSDNGTGMNEQTLARIFEPFFTTKETGKGTGLGLAIAFGIVGNHKGRISVKSAPGKGSTFGIYLPIFKGASPQKDVQEPETAPLYGNETILLVEDETIVLRVTGELLAQYGYTALTAKDGVEALEIFREHHEEIRMVITDMIMPRMNGRAVIEHIRSENPDLPLILMSGYTADIIDHNALQALNVIMLQKPVLSHKLLKTIRSGLER